MSDRLRFSEALCCVLVLTQSEQVFAAAPEFQLGDLKRIVSLRDASISPDGKEIAILVSTPDWKADKSQEEIDIVDSVSGARRAVTWKRTWLASPRWSEDGARLAFLAEDDADERRTQIFVMPMNGGDPIRVTSVSNGVEQFAWSPDGKRIAFITADEPGNAKAIKEHDDAFRVTDGNFLTRAPLTPSHLWVVPSTGGAARRITRGAFSLQTEQNSAPPEWSRDGRGIAFTRFPGPYAGPSYHSVIAMVDANGGKSRTLVPAEGSNAPLYAAGSDSLAYLRSRDGDQNNGNAVYVMEDGKSRDVTQALARNVDAYRWLPGGTALLLEGFDGTRSALWEQPLIGAAKRLALDDVEVSPDLSLSKTGAVAFVGSTPTHPNELYILDSIGAKPRRLTDFNAFVDALTLGRTDSIEWRGPNGFLEDGVLTYPVGYESGRQYPLVLVIHGGPEEASTVQFEPLQQLLSAAGFVVFQPNYRGSTNLGDAYQHAIFRDTGEGPGRDVMAGVTAVSRLGIVDQARIGVTGWSYGGYMTAWLTGHYHIWKAAVAGAALTDWVMDNTVALSQEGDTYLFGGSPWDSKYRDIWRKQSPITYAQNVTAPTLIMGDVGDSCVPLLNSYEWFHALRYAGVEVQFYAYPTDGHFPDGIVRTTDVYRRWVEWMTKRLK